MSWNFIIPFSNMAIWILLFVSLVAPKCSTLALSDNNYKSPTTPTSRPPPYHEYHPPSYPDSQISKNDQNKPPPIFEYFKLAKVWAPTFCKTKTCVDKQPLVDFSLHGLWPQNNSDPQPIGCSTTQEIALNWFLFKRKYPNDVANLKLFWPVLDKMKEDEKGDFWSHEWTNHGTCAENKTPKDYFALAIQISKSQKNLTTILRMAGITPGSNKVSSTLIFNAIKEDISAPEILCTEFGKKDFYLSEIRVCYDKSGGQYKDCVPGTPRGSLNKCPEMVYFPIRK